MSASYAVFQKNLYDITRSDIENFFSQPQEENSILEFKEGSTDPVQLCSEVAAFLNTEGGVLIYGAPREVDHPTKKNYKVASGALTACKVRDRDVIMRTLGTGIVPAPTTIKIHEIPIDCGSVYVLDIGQSLNPPHQVSSAGKYYIRIEREAKPAPHGLVEAMFFKRQKPDLDLKLNVEPKLGGDSADPTITVKFSITNTSLVTAESWGYIIDCLGVSYCHNNDGGPTTTVSNCQARTDGFNPGRLLVRGLNVIFSVDLRACSSAFMLDVTLYAKDTEARTFGFLVDESGEILDSVVSTASDTDRQLDSYYGKYVSRLNDEIKSRLGTTTEKLQPIPNIQDILDYFQAQGIELDTTYVRFFRYSDGFDGKVGNLQCIFFSYQRLTRLSDYEISVRGANRYVFTIGYVENGNIKVQCENAQLTYRMYFTDTNGRELSVPLARTFARLLKKIASAPNLYSLVNDRLE